MYSWQHQASLEWLGARQQLLTASTVFELWPSTPTGKPRKIGKTEWDKAYKKFNALVSPKEAYSVGAAARGHLLEPYAINEFNRINPGVNVRHWDDVVVTRLEQIGFSPDGLDSNQPSEYVRIDQTCLNPPPRHLVEVKSYGTSEHLRLIQALLQSKRNGKRKPPVRSETVQMAFAGYVCPSLEDFSLVCFNPALERGGYMQFNYTRADLEHIMETCAEVHEKWADEMMDRMTTEAKQLELLPEYTGVEERDIYADICAKRWELKDKLEVRDG